MEESAEESREFSLDPGDCLRLLATRRIGRLVFTDPRPRVRPVNYVVYEDKIVVQTSEPVTDGLQLSFEVDQVDEIERQGWSVIVDGRGYSYPVDELDSEVQQRLDPWAPGERAWVTTIVVDSIGGRWVRAGRSRPDPDQRGYL